MEKDDKEIKSDKEDDKIEYLTKEDIQNRKVNLSIEIPKKDFDDFVRAMMNLGNPTISKDKDNES